MESLFSLKINSLTLIHFKASPGLAHWGCPPPPFLKILFDVAFCKFCLHNAHIFSPRPTYNVLKYLFYSFLSIKKT